MRFPLVIAEGHRGIIRPRARRQAEGAAADHIRNWREAASLAKLDRRPDGIATRFRDASSSTGIAPKVTFLAFGRQTQQTLRGDLYAVLALTGIGVAFGTAIVLCNLIGVCSQAGLSSRAFWRAALAWSYSPRSNNTSDDSSQAYACSSQGPLDSHTLSIFQPASGDGTGGSPKARQTVEWLYPALRSSFPNRLFFSSLLIPAKSAFLTVVQGPGVNDMNGLIFVQNVDHLQKAAPSAPAPDEPFVLRSSSGTDSWRFARHFRLLAVRRHAERYARNSIRSIGSPYLLM